MNFLIILNDPPYGTERSYNALRLANFLVKDEETSVSLFLTGDAVWCAVAGQTTPHGNCNIERRLKIISSKDGKIGVCGSCMDARGLKAEALVLGVHQSFIKELTSWTKDADKVFVF